jgi:uncharacterized damage-inducible protein DinB
MDSTIDRIFLDASVRRLQQMTERIEVCLGKLNDEQIWARGAEAENAIGNLILHLCGNLRQWLIAGVGGATFDRDRDAEFAARGGVPKDELIRRLKGTVDEATRAVGAVSAAQLTERVRIQAYEVTVLEAIYHVVEHFGQHYGQIAFATKLLTHEDLGFYGHLSKQNHGQKTP